MQEGYYSQAVAMFTEAIKCDPKDNRYNSFGNDLLITKGGVYIPSSESHSSCVLIYVLQVLWESLLLLLLPRAVSSGPGRCRTFHPARPGLAQRTLSPGQCSHGNEGGKSYCVNAAGELSAE